MLQLLAMYSLWSYPLPHPHIFKPLKWYNVLAAYIVAPVLAFCNAYCCGLTDWSLASTYGKLAIFTIGAWVGASNGGVWRLMQWAASDSMQDFNTGYRTLASPRFMFISQVIGTSMDCIISPCVFWLFYKAFPDFSQDGSDYPAPYAGIYRNMAILGIEGFDTLPAHCLQLCYGFFFAAIAISFIRDVLPNCISK